MESFGIGNLINLSVLVHTDIIFRASFLVSLDVMCKEEKKNRDDTHNHNHIKNYMVYPIYVPYLGMNVHNIQ